MAKTLDQLDLKILKALTQDSRKSITQVAEEAGTTRPTVMARINSLISEEIIDFGAQVNIAKLGLKMAAVHFEARKDQSAEEISGVLKKCPRVIQLIQLTGKAIFTALVVVEDAGTLLSCVECMSSVLKINMNSYQRVLPLIGQYFRVKIDPQKKEITPCGKDCHICLSYQQNECVGCPSSTYYKGPL